jgi:hypothetical protein
MNLYADLGPKSQRCAWHAEDAIENRSTDEDILWAMRLYAELVSAGGPLCHVRFDAEAFEPCLADIDVSRLEETIELAYAQHVLRLGSATFLQQFHRILTQFCAASYVDEAHRLAARAALLLTPQGALDPHGQGRDAPALYVIFRAQAYQALGISSEDAS